MNILKMFCSLIVMLILFLGISEAQEIRYGLSYGFSKTSFLFGNEFHNFDANPEHSYNVKALVDFHPHSRFRFESGVKYFRTSYNVDLSIKAGPLSPAPTNVRTSLSFLSIPLNFNYYLPFFSAGYISVGIEGTFLLSAYSNIKFDDNSLIEQDDSNRYKNFLLSYALGFGIEYKLGTVILFLEPEYTISSDVISKNADFVPNYSIEVITLNIGMKF